MVSSAYSTHLHFGGNERLWEVTSEGLGVCHQWGSGQSPWLGGVGQRLPEVRVWGCAPGQRLCWRSPPRSWKLFTAQVPDFCL